MVQREHSAILSTFIKLPFDNKIFVLSIFERPLKTGFTVLFIMFDKLIYHNYEDNVYRPYITLHHKSMSSVTIVYVWTRKQQNNSRVFYNNIKQLYFIKELGPIVLSLKLSEILAIVIGPKHCSGCSLKRTKNNNIHFFTCHNFIAIP